jgi:hypothetical protein
MIDPLKGFEELATRLELVGEEADRNEYVKGEHDQAELDADEIRKLLAAARAEIKRQNERRRTTAPSPDALRGKFCMTCGYHRGDFPNGCDKCPHGHGKLVEAELRATPPAQPSEGRSTTV